MSATIDLLTDLGTSVLYSVREISITGYIEKKKMSLRVHSAAKNFPLFLKQLLLWKSSLGVSQLKLVFVLFVLNQTALLW